MPIRATIERMILSKFSRTNPVKAKSALSIISTSVIIVFFMWWILASFQSLARAFSTLRQYFRVARLRWPEGPPLWMRASFP